MAIEIPCEDGVMILCISEMSGIIIVGREVVDIINGVFFPVVPHFCLLYVCWVSVTQVGYISCDVISDISDSSLTVVTFTFIVSEVADV